MTLPLLLSAKRPGREDVMTPNICDERKNTVPSWGDLMDPTRHRSHLNVTVTDCRTLSVGRMGNTELSFAPRSSSPMEFAQ